MSVASRSSCAAATRDDSPRRRHGPLPRRAASPAPCPTGERGARLRRLARAAVPLAPVPGGFAEGARTRNRCGSRIAASCPPAEERSRPLRAVDHIRNRQDDRAAGGERSEVGATTKETSPCFRRWTRRWRETPVDDVEPSRYDGDGLPNTLTAGVPIEINRVLANGYLPAGIADQIGLLCVPPQGPPPVRPDHRPRRDRLASGRRSPPTEASCSPAQSGGLPESLATALKTYVEHGEERAFAGDRFAAAWRHSCGRSDRPRTQLRRLRSTCSAPVRGRWSSAIPADPT